MMSVQLSQLLASVMNSRTFLLLPEDQVQSIIKEAQSAKVFDKLSEETQQIIKNAQNDNRPITKEDAYTYAMNSINDRS